MLERHSILMKNYVFIGPPGAGKGTIATKMVEEGGYIHLSTGDLIRQEQKNGTKIGKLADRLIDQGNFLPDIVMIDIFQQFIAKNPTDVGYIFDGYPRTSEQAKHFNAFLLKSKIPFTQAIYFDVTPAESMKRLLKRAETEGRKDDNKATIKHRLGVYDAMTKPVLKFFADRGYLTRVDSSGTIEDQYSGLKKAIA